MKQMMVASKSFRYATRALQPGDNFEASRRDAKILRAIGKAEYGPVTVENGRTSSTELFRSEPETEKPRKPRAKKDNARQSDLSGDKNLDKNPEVDPDFGSGTN